MQSKKKVQNSDDDDRSREHDIFRPQEDSSESDDDEIGEVESSFELENEDDINNDLKKKENIDKVLNRLGLSKKYTKKEKDRNLEMLVGNIVENCVGTIDENANIHEC